MKKYVRAVFVILYRGAPLLITPIGEVPHSTYLVDFEKAFILLERHDISGNSYWTEYGKGKTVLSAEIGTEIEEKNRNAFKVK